jgi:hypothetical protein
MPPPPVRLTVSRWMKSEVNCRRFRLLPFAGQEKPAALAITGRVWRQADGLTLEWRGDGEGAGGISWPLPVFPPERRDGLWQATCFELFFRQPGRRSYWEANISPNGCWNLGYFASYRQTCGDRPEIPPPECSLARGDRHFHFTCRLVLPPLALVGETLELGVATVLAGVDGSTGYWALSHPADRPDFHDPLSFGLRLSPCDRGDGASRNPF